MPKLDRMRATAKMLPAMQKQLAYRTRMMQADIARGEPFEVPPTEAMALRRAGWAEDAPVVATPRRGRPPKPPEPEPPVSVKSDDYEDLTVAELREMAEHRGVELPDGYIRKDNLIATLRGDDAP